MNKTIVHKNILLAILVMVLWGSIFPMIKVGYRTFGIETGYIPNVLLFAGVRFVVCGAVITLYAGSRKKRLLLEKFEIGPVLAVGVFAVILHYTCTYSGLTMTDSSITALIKQLGGFVFIPLSFLFFKEDKFKWNKLIGAVCGFGGLVVLNLTPTGIRFGLGELLVILASLCTVAANVLGKKVMKTVDAIVMTGWSQLFGGVVLLAVGLIGNGNMGTISVRAIMVFAYICTASILGYCIWNQLVKCGNLSQLFIVKFLEPLFAAMFGAMLLGEDVFNARFLLALVFTVCAVLISHVEIGKKRSTCYENKI